MRYYRAVLMTFLTLSVYMFFLYARSRTVTPNTLYKSSQVVVLARCTYKRSFRSSKGGWIFTEYHFRKALQVKGSVPSEFSLKIIGGSYGKYKIVVMDAPLFLKNKNYLLFLKNRSQGVGMLVTGARQGAWSARKSNETGQWEVQVPRMVAKRDSAAKKQSATDRWLSISALQSLCMTSGGVK